MTWCLLMTGERVQKEWEEVANTALQTIFANTQTKIVSNVWKNKGYEFCQWASIGFFACKWIWSNSYKARIIQQ